MAKRYCTREDYREAWLSATRRENVALRQGEAQAEEIARLRAELETRDMQLAGCSTAAIQNTPTSIHERIEPEHPYYSAAYGDVCRAVDREMKHRDTSQALQLALGDARSCVADLADKLDVVERERDALKTQAQKWALYAFNHHGDDAVLYNGLADLGGVSADGSGWMGHATLQQIQRRHGVGTAKAMIIQERQRKDWPTFLADWVDYNHGKGESDRAWDEFQKQATSEG